MVLTLTPEEAPYTYTTRIAYGSAAHNNRGRYTGQKVHRLAVHVRTDEATGRTATSTYPVCGVTGGQHAGQEFPGLTAASVTCDRCRKIETQIAAAAEEG